MKYNQIALPLVLILSICTQSLVAHSEMFKFHVAKGDRSTCANAKRVLNIAAPTWDDVIDNYCSDEKAVTVHVPKNVAKHGKVELTKKDVAKLLLVSSEFVKKMQENLGKGETFKRALWNSVKAIGYDETKSTLIGWTMDKGGSQIELPCHVKNNKFFGAACYAAGKVAGFALNAALDAGYETGKAWFFNPRP